MSTVPVVFGTVAVELKAAPIEPTWILSGTPEARNAILSSSRDRAACTLVWDCTPGGFEWRYDMDETIHILEGRVVLDDGVAPARRLGPGDVVFFPAGAVVRWTVETHVRKLAFFRRPTPYSVALISRAVRLAMRLVRRSFPLGASSSPAPLAHGIAAGTQPNLELV